MWPYGRGRVVPHPAQNFGVYNPGGYPQNQQGTIYTTYAPYAPNPPHSQQDPIGYMTNAPYAQYSQQEPIGYMTNAPYAQYSQQEIGYTTYAPYPLYSQQEIGARLAQDPMASDMVLGGQRDQNWLFQNRHRRETMPEYRNGEVVMVRCNQQKWLTGIIHKMSAQGVRIWVTDANVLVNVPLVLLPTHVLKMSTYSELESLPQTEPMWTITDNEGYRKVLVQCVRPAHLSHRQLVRVLDSNVCAICKTPVSNMIDAVSPWNCRHQVHNHCLQLQVQRNSTTTCPSCNENAIRQLMPLASSSIALSGPSNGQQQQQWLDLQCACGMRSAMVGNMNAPIFCPNCHQPVNVNPMTMDMHSGQPPPRMNVNPITIGMQSGQPPESMNLPRAYLEPKREIPQSLVSSKIPEVRRFFSAQDFRFGWPTQSFSGPRRLEAIEEGWEGNTPSFESTATDEGREEPSYLPSYLQALRENFENNNISDPSVIAMRPIDPDMQPPSSSRSSWQGDFVYEPSRSRTTLIQTNQYSSARSSLQDDSRAVASPSPRTVIQNERSSSRSLLQDSSMAAPSLVPITPIQSEQSRDNPPGSMQHAIGPAAAALVTRVKLIEVEEADESTKQLETDMRIVTATEEHRLWKRASEPNTNHAATEDLKLVMRASETNTTMVITEGQNILKRASEPNTTHAATEDSNLWKRASEPNITHVATEDHRLWRKTNEANTTVATIEGQKLRSTASEVNWTSKLGDDEESEEVEETSLSNDFAASSSSAAPLYINHVAAASEGQKLWRRASAGNWTRKLGKGEESEESEEADSSNDPSSAPVYINHFADFVKLAMGASSSTAEDIIASASASASAPASSIPNPPPLESATPAWVSPPPAFFTRTSLFSEGPAWVTHSKNPDEAATASPAWITVIKDGVDSRKDDKRWELDRLARAKGPEFL